MSLESAIEKLADAITALAHTQVRNYTSVFGGLPAISTEVSDAKPAQEPSAQALQDTSDKAAAAAARAEEKAAKAAVKAAAKKAESKTESTVTREQVATQLIAVVKGKGRDAAIGALKSLGYETVSACPDAGLAALLEALKAAAA